ncbi:MAG: glycerate kinase [Acidimicrobiales bacterium]
MAPTGSVVIAFDKFRGTASAAELCRVAATAAGERGWRVTVCPLADGGEGSLEAVGGPNKRSTVTDPLGRPVEAGWRLEGRRAFIEMARASGLTLAGGSEGNDPIAATTRGTGELIATAIELGARSVTVFLGGSATTDGGWGAVEALPPAARLKEIELVVATDVRTLFVDAAAVFGPQKGATSAQVALLERRLHRLVQLYEQRYGVDVSTVPGAGAAGGLAGGLVAVGGRVEPGFDVVAEQVGLDEALADADLVITGEGHLDRESFNGKVVGGVAEWAADDGVPVLAVVGDTDDVLVPDGVEVVALAARFGRQRALTETLDLVATVVRERLAP